MIVGETLFLSPPGCSMKNMYRFNKLNAAKWCVFLPQEKHTAFSERFGLVSINQSTQLVSFFSLPVYHSTGVAVRGQPGDSSLLACGPRFS